MILYGSSFSPYVRKVMIYATEKGIVLTNEDIARPTPQPAFVAASPLGKMPALSDGDFSISDSTAILTYLEAKFPTPCMLSLSPQDRARTIWYEEYADTIMSQIVFKVFFNRVVAPKFMNLPGDEAAALEGQSKDLPVVLAYLESVVPDAGGYLVGNSLSIADISVASMCVNYDHVDLLADLSHYPRTAAWIARMFARPSIAGLLATERKILGR
jgi:glutathione S-transferase